MLFKKSWLMTNVFDSGDDGLEEEGVVKYITDIPEAEHRWYVEMTAIFQYKGAFYGIPWHKGLTENQENEYLPGVSDHPVIPEYHEVEKVVKVWEPIK